MSDAINTAFTAVPVLRKRIYDAINETPHYATLFEEIAQYHLSSQAAGSQTNGLGSQNEDHPSKKRKLEPGAHTTHSNQPRSVILEARDLSFSLPQRKKLHLGIVQYGDQLQDSSTWFAIQGRNPATNAVEFEYPTKAFVHALRLPVPEKNQKQYNFCLLPQSQGQGGKTQEAEPLIWTVNHGPLKSCQITSPELQSVIGSGPDDILEKALDFILSRLDANLILPTEKEFASALRESHRKNDVAYHVKAFKGSKEGYLFFLSNGIFFGFKKPLLFFPFDAVESISYTSVLQRTFNLNVMVRYSSEEEAEEIEFSMLDQADFAGIDKYVKSHQLQDASLAEVRRVKALKGSKAAKGAEANAEEEGDGQTELEKAQQELEDEEDEMEEDYDPEEDSDDDDGSGSESEDDFNPKAIKGRNLVADELGSEAEDVSVTEDEEEGEEEADEDEEEEEGEGDKEDQLIGKEEEDASMVAQSASTISHSRVVPVDPHAPSLDDEDQL